MSGRIGNTAQSDILKLIYQNVAFANVGNVGGLLPSSVAGSLYMTLNTADPGAAGTASTSEAAYPGYVRQPVPRSSSGFTVSGSSPTQVTNVAQVTFPAATVGAGAETETWFTITLASSGASEILYSGPIGVKTTIASASSGTALPTGTITVASTTGFAAAGSFTVPSTAGSQTITYTGVTGTTFTGCTGGTGTLYTGGECFQAQTITVSGGVAPIVAASAMLNTLS